ncbi:CcdC family protein [Paenibacillus beijingensis]|uniref:Membrane protein n=1 Tax=Paenibacillus beijingensis TaxID=1126833 RepID=A0A0D5NGW4_9BACL|nr:cytochrome c biogenesis protein CcdC [Paenibacillus beijingensis]AJY74614.1 membrane protein [Paenibacillus beijingensis]
MPESIHVPQFLSIVVSLLAGLAIVMLRVRATNKPTTARKIIIPPLGMATGFLMFVVPETHIPWSWALGAFAAGVLLFSLPLIQTSKMEWVGDDIFLRRSKAFIYIILGLLIVRLLLHDIVERYVSVYQTASVFFLLAFGMLVPWRLAMLQRYRKLQNERIGTSAKTVR